MNNIKIGSSYKFIKDRDSEPVNVFDKHVQLEETFYSNEDLLTKNQEEPKKHKNPYINIEDTVLVCDIVTFKATLHSEQKQFTFEKGSEQAVIYLFNDRMCIRPMLEFVDGTEHIID